VKLPIRTILFPVDCSTRSRLAAPYVRAAVRQFGAKLLATHIVDPVEHLVHALDASGVATDDVRSRWVMQGRARLELFAQQELAGLDLELAVEEGDAGRHIVEVADRRAVDWIMLPTHGFNAFRRFILGSVTAHVLHDAHCPVWTAAIREDGLDAAQHLPKEIIAAVGFDDKAEAVLQYASSLAHDCGAALTVVHATPAVSSPALDWAGGDFNDKIERQAAHALGVMLGQHNIKAKVVTRCGDVERVVRAVATEHAADLIVIARGAVTEGAGRLRAHSYGIVNEAPCPVLSV
jgi:nucleotide-binding universal stress UspA family protein